MSNYEGMVRNRATGELRKCLCFDDYYGRHQYGYAVEGAEELGILNQAQFNAFYVEVYS